MKKRIELTEQELETLIELCRRNFVYEDRPLTKFQILSRKLHKDFIKIKNEPAP